MGINRTNLDILSRGAGKVQSLVLNGGVTILSGNGAPVDGVFGTGTGAGRCAKGSLYVRYGTGAVYANTGTKASPVWSQLGSVAALASGHIFVGNAGGAGTDVAMSGDIGITNAGVTSIGANKVLATMVAPEVLKVTQVSIASAAITGTSAGQLGHANGVELVAAVADSVLELVSATCFYDYATAAYTAGGNLTLNYAGGSALTGVVSAANFLGATGDHACIFYPLSAAAFDHALVNTGINLVAASAFTQPGTAAGVLRIQVAYRVHATGF